METVGECGDRKQVERKRKIEREMGRPNLTLLEEVRAGDRGLL